MISTDDIKDGLLVYHSRDGFGEVFGVDYRQNICSIRYNSGVKMFGYPTAAIVTELYSLEGWKEIELEKRICDLISELLESCRDELTQTLIRPGKPDRDDRRLTWKWISDQWGKDDENKAKMLSARLAEKAVKSYFEKRWKCVVLDVSISQLNRSSEDWKKFDLKVKKVSLDVKNARRSQHNPNAYVEYCIPRFKATRGGQEVRIAGALSDWKLLSEIDDGGSLVRYLGTVTESRLNDFREMLADGPLRLQVKSLHSPTFLPLWVFDYSRKGYAIRSDILSKLKACFQSSRVTSRHLVKSRVPLFVAADDLDRFCSVLRPKSWQYSLVKTIMVRQRKFGPSLPALFLTVLDHFVSMLIKAPEDYSPQYYREIVVFGESKDASKLPLFIFDPEEAIVSLIHALTTIWKCRNEELRLIRYFRLKELNILQGKISSLSRWKTILAYCGGWVGDGSDSRRCGKSPLVIGESESCECLKLICPDCGFCSQYCPMCKERQDQMRNKDRN